jgi:hypothetical protein
MNPTSVQLDKTWNVNFSVRTSNTYGPTVPKVQS